MSTSVRTGATTAEAMDIAMSLLNLEQNVGYQYQPKRKPLGSVVSSAAERNRAMSEPSADQRSTAASRSQSLVSQLATDSRCGKYIEGFFISYLTVLGKPFSTGAK